MKKAKNITTSDEMRSLMKRSSAKLMLCDTTWTVEMNVSEQLSGPACETRTKAMCLGFMPTKDKAVDAQEALSHFSMMTSKAGFKLAPRDVKAAVTNCTEWLQSIVAKTEVRLTAAKMTPIAQEVSARLQFFLRCKPSGTLATLVGQTAMDRMVSDFIELDKSGKSSMQTHGTTIRVFKWLVKPDMKETIEAALDRCEERERTADKTLASVASSSSSSKKVAVATKKKTNKAMEEAAAFFS